MKIAIDNGDENERHLPSQGHMNGLQRMNDDRRHANAETDLVATRDAASRNRDDATVKDCDYRIHHADARKEAGRAQDNMNRAKEAKDGPALDASTKARDFQTKRMEMVETAHERHREETEARTGRKLNALDKAQGEEPAARDRWEKREAVKDRAAFQTQEARNNGERPAHERRMARSHSAQQSQKGAAVEYQPRPADFQQRAANVDRMAEERKAQPVEERKKGMTR